MIETRHLKNITLFTNNKKFIKLKKFTVNTVKAEELRKVDLKKELQVGNRSPLCNENHDTKDFVFYLQQTLEERCKLLYKSKFDALRDLVLFA